MHSSEALFFEGGCQINSVTTKDGKAIHYTLVKTMMRIDLPEPLRSGKSIDFKIDWDLNINDCMVFRERTGYEYFEKDGNYLYEIAQWYPRLASYTDYTGWQHKQFLGSGEFTLEFGDYEVSITAPDDHIVTATGELDNPDDVLSETQKERLKEARKAEKPMFIVTPEEATNNESSQPEGSKTWVFKAKDVRDFAFASSRKFIWDAMGCDVNGKTVMAMSFYPKEAEPLWSQYSTHSIAHTLEVYSRYTFDYPYPVAISVNGPVGGGMEYPMICFNRPRPEEDGTYNAGTKYFLITVVIHEVGHNFFPMIVNSDERQWTWMDEGINTFLQYLSEQEWEEDYPSRSGEPKNIVGYMKSGRQVPIMTNSESILQFGPNAYAKPATALNILRETVLGRELFDFAFQEYARRWKFKRPQPADLFRTLEDASGFDLDWFWRGWFYTTDHVDIAISGVTHYELESRDPVIDKGRQKKDREAEPETLAEKRNKPLPKRVEKFPELLDFYNDYDPLDVTPGERDQYEKLLEGLSDKEKDLIKTDREFYLVEFENLGGLVMPIILNVEYEDGTAEEIRIPAEIWRKNANTVSKLIMAPDEIRRITLDPHLETADVDLSNNHFPPQPSKESFQLRGSPKSSNPMRKAQEHEKKEAKKRAAKAKEADE